MNTVEPIASGLPLYLSPKELQERWRCSRSSVDRIARRARLTRLCLGEGRSIRSQTAGMIPRACHERFVDAAVPEMQVRRNGRSFFVSFDLGNTHI